ncbi:MAG: hypothetical protein GEV03_22115 [Streptosporangiales bacterium]|nr:hypothetical protein [Streptosporangiales bacterium]
MRISARPGPLTGPQAADSAAIPAGNCEIHVTVWCLPPATAVRRARGLLRSHLTGHVTDAAVLDDLEVIVGELATNAYRHASGPCEMRVLHHAGVPVVCEIADAGDGLELIAERLRRHTGRIDVDAVDGVDSLTDAGRGLRIVACLSGGRCGARTTWLRGTGQIGKSVWFAIPAETASHERHRSPRVDAGGSGASPFAVHPEGGSCGPAVTTGSNSGSDRPPDAPHSPPQQEGP